MPQARTELWRAVGALPYEVSSLGRVRRMGGNVLSLRPNEKGYLRVQLWNNGKTIHAYVSRLVCTAFNGPPPSAEYEAQHRDKNRQNNLPENLRWKLPTQNRAQRTIARGEGHWHAKLTEDQVRQILTLPKQDGQDRQLAKQFGVSREQVRDVRLRKYWRHVDVATAN